MLTASLLIIFVQSVRYVMSLFCHYLKCIIPHETGVLIEHEYMIIVLCNKGPVVIFPSLSKITSQHLYLWCYLDFFFLYPWTFTVKCLHCSFKNWYGIGYELQRTVYFENECGILLCSIMFIWGFGGFRVCHIFYRLEWVCAWVGWCCCHLVLLYLISIFEIFDLARWNLNTSTPGRQSPYLSVAVSLHHVWLSRQLANLKNKLPPNYPKISS